MKRAFFAFVHAETAKNKKFSQNPLSFLVKSPHAWQNGKKKANTIFFPRFRAVSYVCVFGGVRAKTNQKGALRERAREKNPEAFASGFFKRLTSW
jgi:hypothetical protein